MSFAHSGPIYFETPGKVFLITGAGLGLGRAAARFLVAAGARVMLVDRNGDAAAQAAAELGGETQARSMAVDVLDYAQVEKMVADTISTFGRLDGLINTVGGSSGHGVQGARYIEDLSLEDWDRTMDLNLKSVFYCCRVVVPVLKAQRSGRIVNTASVAGRSQSQLGGPQYAAAKAGVVGFTRQLAFQLAPLGITVNAVAPGPTLSERVTAIWSNRSEEYRREVLDRIPMGRLGEVDESAAAVAFLCSDLASYITGVTIDVNGGLYMP